MLGYARICVAAWPGCIRRNQPSGATRVHAVLGDEPLEVLKAAELSRVVPADRAAARRVVAVKVAVNGCQVGTGLPHAWLGKVCKASRRSVA
jgi:hypothetical protein